jgi:hypothetical protein
MPQCPVEMYGASDRRLAKNIKRFQGAKNSINWPF